MMSSQASTSTTTPAPPGCTGSVTIYNQTGLVVPFKNLCGTDISAPVDFDDPYVEASFADCLARCVEKQPLCYGFDFRPLGASETNCWLKKSDFDERTAVSRDFAVDAAMLGPDVLGGISNDCKSLGLLGCFKKNGNWKKTPAEMSSSEVSSITSTSSSTFASNAATSSTTAPGSSGSSPAPVSSNNGLSTGASVGIGVGIGLIVLGAVIFGILLLLRRRKRKALNVSGGVGYVEAGDNRPEAVRVPEKGGAPTEMYAHQNYHHTAELESPGSHVTPVECGVNR